MTPWLEAAAKTDLGGFVTGLRQDEAAVRTAIVEPWSNGPVEGQVNRLKPITRSMYGRAKFALLRQRVLQPPEVDPYSVAARRPASTESADEPKLHASTQFGRPELESIRRKKKIVW